MFSRLFNLPKREEKKQLPCDWHVSLDDFQAAPRLPKINKANIRVLIFKDCDKKGKSLIFDSDAVIKVTEDKKTERKHNQHARDTFPRTSSSRSLPSDYQLLKPQSDIKMLGEMVFGSVTMTYRGSIVKVHHIRTPPQLLLTKVFAVRTRSSATSVCDPSASNGLSRSNSMVNQVPNYSSEAIEIPVMSSSPNRSIEGSIPIPGLRTPSFHNKSNLSLNSNNSMDSLNISDSMTSLHSLSPSPGGSLNRRWQRSQMMRLHNYQHSKLKADNFDEFQAVNRKQPKIGIGVIFKLWESHDEKNRVFQNFLFSHYSLFEAHVQRLKLAIERSFHPKKNFYVSVIEAIDRFKQDIICFYSAPRLLEPVWLHMMSIRDKQEEIAERFIGTLMKSMDVFEKKEESYFLSSLLTAVLTHHLAWVPTVMPSGSAPKRTYLDKHSSMASDVLAKCHPYNPLWAQLSDLYGAVGYPPKVTKTIVVGKDPTLVRQLLYILSYFIRCSEIKEYSLKKMEVCDNCNGLPVPENDRVSCCSETPTNTPNVEIFCNREEGKVCCRRDNSRDTKEDIELTNQNPIDEKEGKAFADHEEICNCMCSVLQSIDYIGSKGLRNIKKIKNVTKSDGSKQNRVAAAGHRNNELKINEDTPIDGKDYVFLSQNDLDECRRRYPSFRCYCCPEKQSSNGCGEDLEKALPRQISGESEESASPESKSCVCGEGETSEYESETRSNLCTLSRNSSCGSCSDYFKKFESRSQDSDYSSIAYEDHTIETNGIVLDLQEITDNAKSEKSVDDELLSMNLTKLQLPESDIKAVPQRHFDHKVELPNFGRSLLAGYCDKFVSDFALHGVRTIDMHAIERELSLSLKYSVLDESISDAAYIIADVDARTCQLVSLSQQSDYFGELSSNRIVKSDLFGSSVVSEMLESLKGLWHLNIPYQFCLMHLEDCLKDIYGKSKMLAEFVRTHRGSINKEDIQQKMRFSESDLDLVIATGSTHCQFLEQILQ